MKPGRERCRAAGSSVEPARERDPAGAGIELERGTGRIHRNRRAARRCLHEGVPGVRRHPPRGGKRLTTSLQLLDGVQRVELRQRTLGVRRSHGSSDCANLLPQESRGGAVAARARAPTRPAAAASWAHRAAPTRAGTRRRRPRSRASASSRRSRYRGRYCHFAGCAASPFSRSAMARSGRPGPPGTPR